MEQYIVNTFVKFCEEKMPPKSKKGKGLAAKAAELNKEEKQTLLFTSIDELNEQLTSVKDLVTDLKVTTSKASETSNDALTKLTNELTQVTTNINNKVDTEVARINKELKALKERVIQQEAYDRRSNLIFTGLSEDKKEDCEAKCKWVMKDKLKLHDVDSIKIERCHRLGTKRINSKQPRPIIIRFNWYKDRVRVHKARKELQGSRFWIMEDYPQEIRDRRKVLQPIANTARNQGKNAFLKSDILIIDDKSYTVDTLSSLPHDLQPAEVATPHIGDDKRAFWGRMSPCSNFSDSKFVINEVQFEWNEQFYHYSKGVFLKDDDAMKRILECTSPEACLKIGRELNEKLDYPKWREEHGLKAMYTGCHAKFSQNDNLKAFLLSTGDTTLIEASPYDDFWGVKLSLKDVDKLKDEEKWQGTNHLGQILQRVRESLKS